MSTATCEMPRLSPAPLPELVSFAQRQLQNERFYERVYRVERRQEPRESLVVPVLAQPVDQDGEPFGEAFSVVSRDISSSSIGLILPKPAHHQRLALRFCLNEEVVKVVIEVLWCKPMGPFELLGGRFVKKLDQFPGDHKHII